MKQLKKADARAQQGGYATGGTARDSRPLKPPAGQQAPYRFPLAEGAVAALAARGHHPHGEHPAQQPRSGDGPGRPAQQYVRLRVLVRGDRLTVLDSHLVDGPLTAPTTLHGAGVYEVTVGDRLVHAAAVPYLGLEQRSFPNPG